MSAAFICLGKKRTQQKGMSRPGRKRRSCGYSKVTGKEGLAFKKRRDTSFFPLVSNEGKHIQMEGRELGGIQADVLDMEVNWETV